MEESFTPKPQKRVESYEEKNLLSLPGIEAQFFGCPARNPSLYRQSYPRRNFVKS
jgi:hypothetical protein